MKIPSPPYHGATNGLLYAILTGGDCMGYATIQVTSDNVVDIGAPDKVAYALLVVEADPGSSDKSRVIRFKEFDTDNDPPTADNGMPLGHLSVYEVKGALNLKNFRAIGIEPGMTHLLRIQYFG